MQRSWSHVHGARPLGGENFFSELALRAAAELTKSLRIEDSVDLAPSKSLKHTIGIAFSQNDHDVAIAAAHVTREELESKQHFMRFVEAVQQASSPAH
jgi:hypothetical protein